MDIPVYISVLLSVFGIFFGIIIVNVFNYIKDKRANSNAERILEKARKEADRIKRENILEAKEETHKLKMEFDKEIKEKKLDVKESEDRLIQREGNIDRRDQTIQNRELMLEEKENNIIKRKQDIQIKEEKTEGIMQSQLDLLEKVAGFSKKKAKDLMMERIEDSMSKEISQYIKERESEAKIEADKNAKNFLVASMQKYASDVVNEQTVTVVNLPSDEMKGRIIGREGRNIRTIEAITGVDLIVDDTPEAVVLSSFDPLRREIARQTLEVLIKDGRIHPGRIEELYDKTTKDINNKIVEYGEEAVFDLGITKVEPELLKILGKLHFRTSYGQNALQHSKEVGHLAGIMAAEIGEDVILAKRAGLLHDIGKAIDHELEGSHVELGIDLAKKYGEKEVVINSIASHHGDTEATSIISELVAIADALSASRPGARSDSIENYIKRLEQLETIANDVKGVARSFAMQAGREVRVIVKPEEIDDLESHKVARSIKERIEKEMKYPGTIKVTVVRETRATDEAK